MKRIVFLICLLCFTPFQIQANTVKECDSGEIETTKVNDQLIINKRGENPFLKTIEVEGESYFINDIACINDSYVLYGYAHIRGASTYYDNLILVLNMDGDIEEKIITDYGELEEIKHIFFMDNTYIVFANQNEFDEQQDFMKTYISWYNINFELIKQETFDSEIRTIDVNDLLISMKLDTDSLYDVGILSNHEVLYKNHLLDLNETYIEEVYIPFLNSAYINNVKHDNGFYTNYPGYYEIIYNNIVYEFTVEPLIEGVEDNQTYDESIEINVSNGNVFLNDVLYSNNESISYPGNYVLDVYGSNDYHKQISFTINAKVNGVINNHIYEDQLSIEFTGTGYLNGNQVVSPIIVEKEGEYVFRVNGSNGYSEEYFFTVSNENEFNLIDFVQKIDIYIVIVVVIGGVIIIKKSK